MGRVRLGVSMAALWVWLGAGCGGGEAASIIGPPPPSPDFSLAVPSGAITVAQGTSSPSINISVGGENGFTGDVQVSLTGLPTGVSANPASPFAVAAGGSASVVFTVSANASTGSYTIAANGTSGSLSHSANIGLAVQSGTRADLPRSTYVRTDTVAALDNVFGEPAHRHLVYDSANKHLFVANRAMNRVEVFSSADMTRVKSVPVAGATSVDISVDGHSIWVGTAMQGISLIDTASLQVTAQFELAGIAALPGIIFDRPLEISAMANGKGLVRLRQELNSQALLALWDSHSNALTNLTSVAPQLFQNGVGVLTRTGDHTKAFVASNDATAEMALFDSNGNVVAGPKSLGSGQILRVAANSDGTHYMVALNSSGTVSVLLLDGALNTLATHTSARVYGLIFSRDGQTAFICETFANASAVTALDANNGNVLGQVPDLWLQGVGSEIEDADESQLLFGLANRGVSFIDAATPTALSGTVPVLAFAPSVSPSEGSVIGGTAVTIAGQNFTGDVQLKFDGQFAGTATITNAAQIIANSPPNAAGGASNVAAYFAGGWLSLAPDAFTYGPQILQISPNAGTKNGGDTLQIVGYGFGSDASKVTVKVGSASATVQKVESLSAISSSVGFDNSYPFPLERITLQTPAGVSGKADITVNAASGSTTSPKGFQYLQNIQNYSRTGPYKFVLYDQSRQHIYLSATDHIDVFDLQQGVFLPMLQPPGGPPPNAGLRGMTLTPDSAKLVVADFGAQSVYLLDPVSGNGTTVPVGGVAGFLNSGPSRVASTSAQTVFVGLSGEGGSSGACSGCLAQMNLSSSPISVQPAPQPEVTSLTGAPLLQASADGDRVFMAFGTTPGGPLASWSANAPNQFTTSRMNTSINDVGVAGDGTMFAVNANGSTEMHGADLALYGVPVAAELTQIPGRISVPGLTMHPSGALVYQPFLTGVPGSNGVKGGIDIVDAHSGALRMRIFLPQQLLTDVDGLHGSFQATDENGQRLFALTTPDGLIQNDALTVIQLANVPLGIGTVQPAQTPAAGGASLTIRGSGFQSGTIVNIGGKSVASTYKDMNTLTVIAPAMNTGAQQLTLKNPDGETVALDAALIAN